MAKSSTKSSETNVTRIKAGDSSSTKKPIKAAKAKPATAHTVTNSMPKPKRAKALRAIGRYFKGAWVELGQVRWPDRRATWGMTGALLAFTAFFVVIILLLDAGFKYLFKLLIGV